MKRKLICVLFIIAGVAAIAGTILLSLKRSEYADSSPVLALILFSVITIIAAARNINREPLKPEVSGREKTFLRCYRAVCILAILICLAFVAVMFFISGYYTFRMQNVLPLTALAIAGSAAAALSMKERPPLNWRSITKASIALVITAALCFVYLRYMPKYSMESAMDALRSKKEFTQTDVYYDGGNREWNDPELFKGNPFYLDLFAYNCDSYSYDAGGLHAARGYIQFNPATGEYKYTLKEKRDMTFSSGIEAPFFSSILMQSKDGQHDTVINLYLRKPWGQGEHFFIYPDSGERDVKIKEVMYPHNFPGDKARAFLRDMGKEMLKTKVLWCLSGSQFKDETIEVFFCGIDIATYQDGEIILKI